MKLLYITSLHFASYKFLFRENFVTLDHPCKLENTQGKALAESILRDVTKTLANVKDEELWGYS